MDIAILLKLPLNTKLRFLEQLQNTKTNEAQPHNSRLTYIKM